MKARIQAKDEAISPYFHVKARLCVFLGTFHETKTEILIGLWSRELCNAVMPTQQYTRDQLFHDIL